MATAKKLPSGSWRCQVFSHYETVKQPDGSIRKKRIYKSFTSDDPTREGKKLAELAAAQYAAEKRGMASGSSSNLTFGAALDKYITERESVLSPGTIREYKRSRKVDLQGLIDIRLRDITQDMIQQEINRESKTHSPKSVRNMHGLLSAVMHAYRPDFALHTDLPKKVRPKIYVPSDAEIQKLMEYVEGDVMEIPILLAAFGPMRRGEICALESQNIHGNTVHVKYAMALNDKNEWVVKTPKSYAGDRYITFPDFVIEKIKGKKGRIVDLSPAQVSDRFIDVLKRAEIPHFRFHDLRHYCASLQHALGVSDAYIMERGGWENDAVLKSIYRHTMSDKTTEMDQKANDYFSILYNTKCNTK